MTKRKLENDLKDPAKPKKLKLKDKEHTHTNSLVRGEVNALPAIPGLCISNFGEIPLPISEIQAESLAKFLDESIEAHKGPNENVYELKPSEIEIKNKIWKRNLSILTSKLAPELGHKSKTEAKFNKLLFFTKGASLKRAKDELKEHQFATLIIQLPSCFTGGDLVVYGKNSHKRCDFGLSTKKSPFSVHYAAYNSDYEREVMEVKSGCRFFLVYDLCLAPKKVELPNNFVNVNDFFIGFLPWIEMQLMVNLEHKNNAYHDEHALRTLESLIRNRNLRLAQDFIGNVLRRFSKTMCACIAGLIKLFGWHPLQTCLSRFLIPITFENFSVNCCLVQCLLMLNEENSAFLCFDRCVKPVLTNKEDFKSIIQNRYGFVEGTRKYIDLARTILLFKDPECESYMSIFNASIINTLASNLYPNLLIKIVNHLSEYKSNNFLLDLFKHRINCLEAEIKKIDDKFKWPMPEASMPEHKEVQEFLRSASHKMVYSSVFKTSHDAREFIKLHGDIDSQLKNGYSVDMVIDKNMSTSVKIHKTRKYYESRLSQLVKYKQELINTMSLYANFKKNDQTSSK